MPPGGPRVEGLGTLRFPMVHTSQPAITATFRGPPPSSSKRSWTVLTLGCGSRKNVNPGYPSKRIQWWSQQPMVFGDGNLYLYIYIYICKNIYVYIIKYWFIITSSPLHLPLWYLVFLQKKNVRFTSIFLIKRAPFLQRCCQWYCWWFVRNLAITSWGW